MLSARIIPQTLNLTPQALVLIVSLRVERHTLRAVLALGGLELVEYLPVGRQLLPEQKLSTRDPVELLAEQINIITQVCVVIIRRLLFSIMR